MSELQTTILEEPTEHTLLPQSLPEAPVPSPQEDTLSPLVPIASALISAAATGFCFWVYAKIKAKRAAKDEVVPFLCEDDAPPPDLDATAK